MQLLLENYVISCLSQDINYFSLEYISFTLDFDSAAINYCKFLHLGILSFLFVNHNIKVSTFAARLCDV